MKKIALILFALLAPVPAYAGVTCSLPFNLQNGTTADATQVMANYNALLNCFSNAAASGVNNDITALSALSTPLTPAQGGTPVYIGGTSTGSANAQVVGVVQPATFSLTSGNQVTFGAGFTPTGPLTLNVASTGATAVYRRTQLGISPTVGGEFIAGQAVTVMFDGTRFQIISTSPAGVGEIKDWAGSSAPPGWAFIDGSCQARTGIFADLYSVIGTTYDPTGSTCDTAHFALPDGRGRVLPGYDAMGQGAANRLTTAGCTAVGGAGCGAQTETVAQANLPSSLPGVTASVTIASASISGTFNATASGGGGNSNVVATASGSGAITPTSSITSATISGSLSTTLNTGGSGTALTTLPPMQVVTKIIKY